MFDRRRRRTDVQRLARATVLLLTGCVTVAPVPAPPPAPSTPEPMRTTFQGRRARKVPLDVATDRLLAAIEEETGVRPAGDGDDEEEVVVRPRRVKRGWGPERSALAHALVRAVDRREAGVRAVRRALAAFEWDRMVGGRWPEVDQLLVAQAIERAEAALPREEPPPAPDAERRTLLAWPVIGSHVTSPFGWRSDPLEADTQFHAGIDLSAIEGQLVYAAATGKVGFAGRRGGYGLHVELEHANGVVTRYAHLDELVVSKGQSVKQGDPIAYAGRTGRVTGPHLHFELWRRGRPTNPLDELPDEPPVPK